ncbi:TrbG/VirB9 family P-type conjugative transfer protein [Komagataeibacter xylinus]|uniref:Conjugal transfer protein TraO n=1 Tax=Komagataeibacter xylinus TaxID=28448 RepID=A0A857FM14_KOMXY|nr:TrbG/VirB9 family P-type conjugative transfer protein [Komagataeibacter xylinus]QHC35205.1 conjugal transfer protein TraO [Komagataeibacter xylinus]
MTRTLHGAWCMAMVATLMAPVMCPLPAGATGRKSASPYDYRIKSVIYNPRDTVEVDGVVGIATDITLAPDEHYVTHAFGEEGGWSFACRENHCFIRPKAQESDTNLAIVTDRRTYHILLHYVGGQQEKGADGVMRTVFAPTPWALAQATVELTYVYPDENDGKKAAAARASHIEAELADPYGDGPHNTAYRRSDGTQDRAIAPLNVWDDYRFTYFRFPENGVLPTLYVMNESGQETVVNAVVLGRDHNILAAQMTARQWRIRYGSLVIGVVNDGFNPSLGSAPGGTISPMVRRVVRDGAS